MTTARQIEGSEMQEYIDTVPSDREVRYFPCGNETDPIRRVPNSTSCVGFMYYNPPDERRGVVESGTGSYVFLHFYEDHLRYGRLAYATFVDASDAIQNRCRERRHIVDDPLYSALYRSSSSRTEPEFITGYCYDEEPELEEPELEDAGLDSELDLPDHNMQTRVLRVDGSIADVISARGPANCDGLVSINPTSDQAITDLTPDGHFAWNHVYDDLIRVGAAHYVDIDEAIEGLKRGGVELTMLGVTPVYSVLFQSDSVEEPIHIGGMWDHPRINKFIPPSDLYTVTMQFFNHGVPIFAEGLLPPTGIALHSGRVGYDGEGDGISISTPGQYIFVHALTLEGEYPTVRLSKFQYDSTDAARAGCLREIRDIDENVGCSILYFSTSSLKPIRVEVIYPRTECIPTPSTECVAESVWTLDSVCWGSCHYGKANREEGELFVTAVLAYRESAEEETQVIFTFVNEGGSRTECVVQASRDATFIDFLKTVGLSKNGYTVAWALRMAESDLIPSIARIEGSSYIHVRQTGISLRSGAVTAYLVPMEGSPGLIKASFAYHKRGKINKKLGNAIARMRYAQGCYVTLMEGGSRYETIERYLKSVYVGNSGEYSMSSLSGDSPVRHPHWLLPPKREIPKDIEEVLQRIMTDPDIDEVVEMEVRRILSRNIPADQIQQLPDLSAHVPDGEDDRSRLVGLDGRYVLGVDDPNVTLGWAASSA